MNADLRFKDLRKLRQLIAAIPQNDQSWTNPFWQIDQIDLNLILLHMIQKAPCTDELDIGFQLTDIPKTDTADQRFDYIFC